MSAEKYLLTEKKCSFKVSFDFSIVHEKWKSGKIVFDVQWILVGINR
jgi:hypothetical protein